MRRVCAVTVTDEERKALRCWSRGRSTPARVVARAKIILRAAEGMMNKDIAAEVGTDEHTVARWRLRFSQKRLGGITKDAPRSGRPPRRRQEVACQIVERTIQTVPPNATHWTVRTLARELGQSASMVHRVWKANGLKPYLTRAT